MIKNNWRDVSMIYDKFIVSDNGRTLIGYYYFSNKSNESYLVKLDYIWMSNDLQDVDFSGYSFDVRLILDLIFLKYFDCDFLASYQVCTKPDFTEGSLTKRST